MVMIFGGETNYEVVELGLALSFLCSHLPCSAKSEHRRKLPRLHRLART